MSWRVVVPFTRKDSAEETATQIRSELGWMCLVERSPVPADDPPGVDPEDAEAQRIAETYADARAEVEAIEAGGEVCP